MPAPQLRLAPSPAIADAARSTAPAAPAPRSAMRRDAAALAAGMADPLAAALSAFGATNPMALALRQLQDAARERWHGVAGLSLLASDIAVRDSAGRVLGHLRIDDSAVWWQAGDAAEVGSAWRAVLDKPALDAVRAALAAAAAKP